MKEDAGLFGLLTKDAGCRMHDAGCRSSRIIITIIIITITVTGVRLPAWKQGDKEDAAASCCLQ